MDEPIDAEIKPARWTFTSLAVAFFWGGLGTIVWTYLEEGAAAWEDYLPGIVLVGVLAPLVYLAAHEPDTTEAWFEGGRLVVRDPNPWWISLTAHAWEEEISLKIERVEESEKGLVVTGSVDSWWGDLWRNRFKVQLEPGEERRQALEARLADLER